MVAVVLAVMALLPACSPTRNGYFLPQTNAVAHLTVDIDKRIVPVDTVPTLAKETDANPVRQPATAISDSVLVSALRTAPTKSSPYQHRNPESRTVKGFNRLFNSVSIAHVAPGRQTAFDQHSPARKIHPLALVALGISVLAYAPLLVAGGGTLVWVASFILPLAALMLGVASLATINRNKDRLRGKGWAMAAVIIGTGVLGLAMVALAALSMSKVIWEK